MIKCYYNAFEEDKANDDDFINSYLCAMTSKGSIS